MQRVWAWDPVRHARDVGGVVAAMTRLVVAVREDGQMTLGLRCGELWLRAGFVEGVATSVELKSRGSSLIVPQMHFAPEWHWQPPT